MIDCDNFSIVVLGLNDAVSLNNLMLKNSKRFQRFFPMTLAENRNLKMSEAYILKKETLIVSGEEYTLGIKDKVSKQIVGLIIIKNINRDIADGEVAYCLDADFGGKGIMTNAVKEICCYAKVHYQLNTLFIMAHKTNKPSIRVAEKAEFTWSSTKLNSYTPVDESEALDMEKYVKTL